MLVCVAMLWDVAMHSMFVHYYINALARFLKADFVGARLIKKPIKKREVYGWFQANSKVLCKLASAPGAQGVGLTREKKRAPGIYCMRMRVYTVLFTV